MLSIYKSLYVLQIHLKIDTLSRILQAKSDEYILKILYFEIVILAAKREPRKYTQSFITLVMVEE